MPQFQRFIFPTTILKRSLDESAEDLPTAEAYGKSVYKDCSPQISSQPTTPSRHITGAGELPEYADLTVMPGVRVLSRPSRQSLVCPFCRDDRLLFLAGDVSFAAKISGDNLYDGELTAFVCPHSHIFFLMGRGVVEEFSNTA